MFNSLAEIASYYALVPLNTKRSTNLKELITQIDFKNIVYKRYGTLKTAYNKLLKMSSLDDIIIVIGSHYLVGEFRDEYNIL